MSVTTTLRPDSDVALSGYGLFGGGAGPWQTLSDNNDATFLQATYDGSYVAGFGTFQFANALIQSVTLRARGADANQARTVTSQFTVSGLAVPITAAFNTTASWVTASSAALTTQSGGAAWTQSAIDNVNVGVAYYGTYQGQFSQQQDPMYWAELYLDVLWNRPPTCHVVGPSGRSVTDAVTTVASTTLTSATAAFAAADVGKGVTSTSAVNQVYADGATTAGSQTVTSATAAFTADDLGKVLSGGSIPASSTIIAINSATSVNLSAAATATATGVSVTVNSRQVVRTGTTIASVTNATTVVLSTAAAATATAVQLSVGSPITTTNAPPIVWTYLDPDGDGQERFWVKVFTQAVVSAGGFSPDTAATVLDSGETYSGATSWTPPTPMAQNTSFVAYVKVADAGSGGRYSAWSAGPVFSIAPSAGLLFDPPATPSVTATADSVNNRVTLAVQGIDNDLTRNQSSFESSILGWEADTNCAVVRDTTQFLHGLASMKLTSTAAGDMTARTYTGSAAGAIAGYQNALAAVSPNVQYTALASFRSAVSGRSCRVDIRWFTSAGALISTSTGGTVTDTTVGWTQASVTATAPGTAAYASVVPRVLATGAGSEVHWVDQVDLGPGSSTTWTRGGFTQNQGRLADTFTRADSASSLGSSEGLLTPAWTALSGTWGIQSNRGYPVSTGGTEGVAVLASPVLADGVITCDVTLSPTVNRADAGLVLRGIDASNFLLVEITKKGTGNADAVAVWKKVAGTYTQLGTGYNSAGLVNGATYGLKAEIFGGLIRVWLDRKDGKGYAKVVDTTMVVSDIATFGVATANRYGLWYQTGASFNDDLGSRFDNFAVNNANNQVASIERSYDAGATWAYVRTARLVDLVDPGQTATLYDYEVSRQTAVAYRVQVQAVESDVTVQSPWSSLVAMSPNLASDGNSWLKSPTNPALNVALVLVKDSADSQSLEDQVIYAPLGRADYLIHGGTIRNETFPGVEFLLRSDAEWAAFETLRKRQEPLLLQTCYGDTGLEEFWVRLGPSRQVSRLSMATSPLQLRRVKVPATQVLQPVVL